METTLNFSKRSRETKEEFHIADVTLAADATITIDGKELPAKSVEYLVAYGVRQALGDAYAGATDRESALGAFNQRLDAIHEGTIGMRTGGGRAPANPIEALALKNAKAAIHALLAKASGGSRIRAFFESAKTAEIAEKYFNQADGDKWTWNDDAVRDYIEAQKDAGKRDFMAEAEDTINGTDDDLGDL